MRYLIAFFATLLFLVSCNSNIIPQSIRNRIDRYDTLSVFLPVIRSEKLLKYFPEEIFEKYYDKENHDFDINRDNGLFFKEFSSFYNRVKDTGAVLNVIDNWCIASKFIDSLGGVNPEHPPEAILFYTEETKFIINNFLTHPGQGWFSLSSFQLYESNIAFMNYVDKLSIHERDQLFLSLERTADNLSSEK